jgi:hypothetical protein
MKYTKPEVVAVATALSTIQNQHKGMGGLQDNIPDTTGYNTVGAYQADE